MSVNETKNFIYTGVGSRETPEHILKTFEEIGKFLAYHGFTLRSGHAPGSDIAFERGSNYFDGRKEIYLPWYRFENSNSHLCDVGNDAYAMAARYHPYWSNIGDGAKKLLARDCYQMLGLDLKTPSSFLICWTKLGMPVGGTAMAIAIAMDYGIPTFNYGLENAHANLQKFLMNNYGLKLL